MFAYCGNNPILRKDDGGEFWHIAAGAVVGMGIGLVTQIVCNAIEGKQLHEGLGHAALTGALGGALTAAFPAASTAINAGISAAESAISDIKAGENLPTILTNATLSAGFAAVTSGDTIFRDKTIVKNTFRSVARVLPGNHPVVKQAARKALYSTGRQLYKEAVSGISDGVFVNYVKKGTQFVSGLYTQSRTSQEFFAYE